MAPWAILWIAITLDRLVIEAPFTLIAALTGIAVTAGAMVIGGIEIDASASANAFGPPPPWTPKHLLQTRTIQPAMAARVMARMRRQKRPTLLMAPAPQATGSRLGGLPDLEDDFPWPVTKAGEPLAFVAQIALAQAAAGGPEWLPQEGYQFLFHARRAVESSDSFHLVWRVRTGPAAGARRARPFLSEKSPIDAVGPIPAWAGCAWIRATWMMMRS